LLSPENEFEGGDLELMSEGKIANLNKVMQYSLLHL